jgi:hypothetical protein
MKRKLPGEVEADASQAEKVRQHWLTFDCVAKVRILDEPDWVSL